MIDQDMLLKEEDCEEIHGTKFKLYQICIILVERWRIHQEDSQITLKSKRLNSKKIKMLKIGQFDGISDSQEYLDACLT